MCVSVYDVCKGTGVCLWELGIISHQSIKDTRQIQIKMMEDAVGGRVIETWEKDALTVCINNLCIALLFLMTSATMRTQLH